MVEPKQPLANGFDASRYPSAHRGSAAVPKRGRCRFARGSGSGNGLTDEITCLLRTRLRQAGLIILCAFLLHFFRNLLAFGSALWAGPMGLVLQAVTIVAIALVSAALWSYWPLGMKQLRLLELTIFGISAAFFTWLHWDFLRSGLLPSLTADGQEARVVRLLGSANTYRWFLLIVVYGTFIPNNWRRCAAVTGCMALMPIALTLATPWLDPTVGGYAGLVLPDTLILMGVAIAVAVFGSHKIRELHEKAHEAQKFGRYQLKQKLGAGGMGEVYLAEHILLRRPCAIKLIRPDQAGNPQTLLRFEREVRATATLTHWNTVEIFDYGHADDGTFYYVMEYLPGMNLEELVEAHGPMPHERAVHLLRQVCQALREAHSIGLIHRDIKPSNVIACERGKVHDVAKLLDFGMVKSFGTAGASNLTREGSMAGSPAYMSPEQAAGRKEIDGRSDIYNVGAVAYYLITGQLVFDRETPLQMLHAHAYEALVPLPEFQAEVPDDLQQVILRCLEKDPARRHADAESLEKALAACQCAGEWTPERAADWWQQVDSKTPLAAAVHAVEDAVATVLVQK